ncbi:uncharacterized protein V6R79_011135 [Siganus canaliculatus]
MKSSETFFTRQNPCQTAPRAGKLHHNPSRKQSLSKQEKKTSLSPVKSKKQSHVAFHPLDSLSKQLTGHDRHDQSLASIDGQPIFTEIWPSTGYGPSPTHSKISSAMKPAQQSAKAAQSTVSSEPEIHQDSVLAKYIDRFRHGQPQSREERQQLDSITGGNPSFWWVSPSSSPHSSTPTKTTDKDVIQPLKGDCELASFPPAAQRQRDRSLSPCRESLSILSNISHDEFDETEILHLQQKANRLLLRNECSLSDGSVHVSSEGLGCSDASSPINVDEPLQRPSIPIALKSASVKDSASSQKSVIPALLPPTRPEEDILFQWRLRRKIEQARERPQTLQHSSAPDPTFRWQAPTISQPFDGGKADKQLQSGQTPDVNQNTSHSHASWPESKDTQPSCPPASGPPPVPAFLFPGSSASQTQAVAHIPAHTHFLCDILPCPAQSSHGDKQQNIIQSINESQTKFVHKKTSENVFTDEATHKYLASSPPTPTSGATEDVMPGHHRRPERNKKEKPLAKESGRKTGMPSQKQHKSRCAVARERADAHGSLNRSSSHQGVPNKDMPWTEQHQQKESQEFSSEGSSRDYVKPPSPVHSALGQVVSEVLFPTVDSSPPPRASISSVPSPHTTSAVPQSSVPPSDAQNSMEVISQLLREAEDSDGKEFEDDPLLQVLRKQRRWVKGQISEVDSVLSEFLDEQQVT